MAIVGRTATVVESASATSVTGKRPTDRVVGDLCIAVIAMESTTANFTGPSGWTALITPTQNPATTETFAAYYRVDPPSDPVASTSGAAGRCSIAVQAYGGVSTTNPIDVAAVVSTGSSVTSLTATGVTTVTNGALIISGHMGDTASRSEVIPSGMTSTVAYSASSVGRAVAIAEELKATAGATGTRTWTFSPSVLLSQSAFVTALRPGNSIFPAGTISATGVTTKRVNKNPFTASVTATGVLTTLKVVAKIFTGSITATGAFAKRANKVIAATISATGVNIKRINKSIFTGSITATPGTFRKAGIRTFTGSITATSTFATTFLGRVFGRPGIARVVAARAAEVIIRIRRT